MKAEEQYVGDYAIVMLLRLLVDAQEKNQHEVFAGILGHLWSHVLASIPVDKQCSMAVIVLTTYFDNSGDMRNVLRATEEILRNQVGHEAHREAIERMSADSTYTAIQHLLKLVYAEKQP